MKTKIYIINFIYPHQFISKKKKNQQKMLMHKIKIELGYQQIKKKHIPNDYKISFIQRKQFICA